VIGEAGTSDEAWKMSSQLLPDIVLLDLHLPGFIQSFDLVKKLASLKNVRICCFSPVKAKASGSAGPARRRRCGVCA